MSLFSDSVSDWQAFFCSVKYSPCSKALGAHARFPITLREVRSDRRRGWGCFSPLAGQQGISEIAMQERDMSRKEKFCLSFGHTRTCTHSHREILCFKKRYSWPSPSFCQSQFQEQEPRVLSDQVSCLQKSLSLLLPSESLFSSKKKH